MVGKKKTKTLGSKKIAFVIGVFVLITSVVVGAVYSYGLSKNKTTNNFDRAAAKKAGYSDQEIDEYLQQKEKLCRAYSESQGKFVDIPCDELKPKAPSERALKAAAFVYLDLNTKEQKELEQRMLATGSATLTIRNMAWELDNDLSKLILVETYMQKDQNNQSIGGYSGNDSDTSIEDLRAKRQQQCQEETSRYTACMSEYSAKMNEYNSCLTEKQTKDYMFCSKPSNFCGSKPFCP